MMPDRTVLVIWLTKQGNPGIESDPLWAVMGTAAEVVAVLVAEEDSVGSTVGKVLKELEEKGGLEGRRTLILIDAFLRPREEGVREGAWPNEPSGAGQYLNSRSDRALLSLRLMLSLRKTVPRHAAILISTNGIDIDNDNVCLLDSAFGAGWETMVYGWDSSRALLEDAWGFSR